MWQNGQLLQQLCCNMALCNETIYVATTHTVMKQFEAIKHIDTK
jgi:hypothetical protein